MNKDKLFSQHLSTSPEVISLPYSNDMRRDTKARDILNKVLGTSFVNVWTTKRVGKSKGSFSFDGEGGIICLRKDGIVVNIEQSEWLSIEEY